MISPLLGNFQQLVWKSKVQTPQLFCKKNIYYLKILMIFLPEGVSMSCMYVGKKLSHIAVKICVLWFVEHGHLKYDDLLDQ